MRKNNLHEKEVVSQILSGNESALRTFYKHFQYPLYLQQESLALKFYILTTIKSPTTRLGRRLGFLQKSGLKIIIGAIMN